MAPRVANMEFVVVIFTRHCHWNFCACNMFVMDLLLLWIVYLPVRLHYIFRACNMFVMDVLLLWIVRLHYTTTQ
jgi:hypothetical protein